MPGIPLVRALFAIVLIGKSIVPFSATSHYYTVFTLGEF